MTFLFSTTPVENLCFTFRSVYYIPTEQTWLDCASLLFGFLMFYRGGAFVFLFWFTGYGNDSAGSSAARSYPVSLVMSGYYYWQKGIISSQNVLGLLWSSSLVKQGEDWVLVLMLGSDFIRGSTQEYFHGFSLRCVNNSNLH